jgi:amino acid transporter
MDAEKASARSQAGQVIVAQTQLQAGALGLVPVLMQGVTHIAPAVGLVLTIQFIASQAGVTAPLAYFIAFLIVMTLGIALSQLAKYLPSAGGYYTYVSRTISPRAGFLTAWLYFLYDPTGAAINIAFMGYFFNSTLQAEWGVTFPWWLFFLLATALITILIYRGIRISTETVVLLGAAEMAIVVALALSGLIHPGSGGIDLSSYNPGNAPSANGLFLGVIFAIFAFTGFESVAPLAEETKSPRRTQPQAIIGSLLIMGAFYLFCSWGSMVGWGTHHVTTLINAKENPLFVLAKHLWDGLWILVFLAVINSIIAVSIATSNAATRVFFGMARSGSLPRRLTHVHPTFRTPVNAIILQTVITLVFGLGLGFWLGPDQEFYLMGVAITLGLIFVYGAGNIGVMRYYWTERRSEFNPLLHGVFPLFSTLALIYVGYKSIVPLPSMPVGAAPYLVGVWLVGGAVLVGVMSRTGKEEWLVKAGEAAHEVPAASGAQPTPAGGAR